MTNIFVDSVPFRPGYYRINEPWHALSSQYMNYGQRNFTQSFGAYYAQHAAALADANPLAGYHFAPSLPGQEPGSGLFGRPTTPSDIFAQLLQRTTYHRVLNYHLVPVHRTRKGRYVPDRAADRDPHFDAGLD